jgi:hypothetical protein
MVIDFQAHVFPAPYIDEIKRRDGAVILEPPDPASGLSYFYDRKLGCRINTATFQGRDIERRIEHMDRLGIDIQVLTIPAPGGDRFEGGMRSASRAPPTTPSRRSAAGIPGASSASSPCRPRRSPPRSTSWSDRCATWGSRASAASPI